MSTTLPSKVGNRVRSGLLTAAIALAWSVALPAHAQWGGLLQNLMQKTQEIKQQADKKQAEEEAKKGPYKKWGTPKAPSQAIAEQARDFAQATPVEELRPLFERLYIEGERNATLNLQRIGLAALALGRLDLAEKALDGAAFRIDLIYADNPEAQKAKSLWNAEKVKDFKGEPYERAMSYFYRGLVYAARGDFQNARAMFKQADYQDTVAEVEQFAGDFALMPYMAGWASYCDGDSNMAKDFLKQAVKGDKNYSEISVEQPVLVLFETGRTPFKYSTGKYDELLKWQPHPMPEQTVSKACAGEPDVCFADKLIVGADIGFQAMTRGGRPIDAIMNGKAAFKEGADTVANVSGVVGQVGLQAAAMSGNRDMGNLGLFGSVASLTAMGVSAATQTQADIREWEQLPGTVWLGTGTALQPASTGTVTVATSGSGDEKMALSRLVNTPKCQLYWGRSLTPLSLLSYAGPIEPGVHNRDPAFRQAMTETFATK